MLRDERVEYIIGYLKTHPAAKVSYLSKLLGVSSETIRRDFDYLESSELINRVHGGAILNKTNTKEAGFQYRELIYKEEKEEIAKEACKFVEEGDFLAMDVSTTNTELARELVRNFDKLSVITNSLTIAMILSSKDDFSIFLPDGILKNSELCIVGPSCVKSVCKHHIDKFFMSISGISAEIGLTDYGYQEYEVKMAMLENSSNVFVLADHSKFGNTSMFKVCEGSAVNGIITDSRADEKMIEDYSLKDINIIVGRG